MRYATSLTLVLIVTMVPALAGADLVLHDGEVLEGVSVERKGLLYMLENEDGDVIPVPVELVQQLTKFYTILIK